LRFVFLRREDLGCYWTCRGRELEGCYFWYGVVKVGVNFSGATDEAQKLIYHEVPHGIGTIVIGLTIIEKDRTVQQLE